MTSLEPLTPGKSTIILIDFGVGFANLIGSTDVAHNVNGVVALARIAKAFDVPLIITGGQDTDVPGPFYPQVLEVLGEHPIVRRGGNFNAFETPEFVEAVSATGRKKLFMAGLMTEGCVLLTALDGVRRGFDVYVVVDACGGETVEGHQVAVQRLIQAGVVPVTWFALAAEYQQTWARQETVQQFTNIILHHAPTFGMHLATFTAAKAAGQLAHARW